MTQFTLKGIPYYSEYLMKSFLAANFPAAIPVNNIRKNAMVHPSGYQGSLINN